jgi:hypothetical protein
MTTKSRASAADKYRAKVVVSDDPDACWGWGGSTTWGGYGHLRDGTRTVYAHRVSYELHIGEIPAGLLVLHRCDNPPCSNPKHLFLGTNADNAADRDRKGRRAPVGRGTEAPAARLTEAVVAEIIRRYRAGEGSHRSLGREYGVHGATIGYILKGKIWKHVDGRDLP